MRKTWIMLLVLFTVIVFTGCSEETLDYDHPDVDLFVKQLKAGNYNAKDEKGVIGVPHFSEEDIPELFNYAEDLTIIPSFPSVYNSNSGKIRLGECILWVIESIRSRLMPKTMKLFISSQMRKYWMQLPVIAVGGRTGIIRAQLGRSILVMTNLFAVAVTVGGRGI